MRHQCTSCLGEFTDDAPEASRRERVYCVFCGTELLLEDEERVSAVPFSADFPREEAFALGVIGTARSGFPDTLRQFRAHGAAAAKASSDSLSPVHSEPEGSPSQSEARPWRLGSFWTSLAVGFAVGALAAVLVGERSSAPQASARAAAAPVVPVAKVAKPAAPPIVASACTAAPSAAAPAVAAKPVVTPVLERRFWLDRARSSQRQYRLADAELFYRRALAQTPHDSEALAGLGEVALLRGAPDVASARFNEALVANSSYVPALVALADLHWQSGRAEEARRAYRDIAEQYSSDLYPPYVTQRLEGDACVPKCR